MSALLLAALLAAHGDSSRPFGDGAGDISGGALISGACSTSATGDVVCYDVYGAQGGVLVTDAVPGVMRVSGKSASPAAATNTAGANVMICGGLGSRRIALTQANCTAASDTITIRVESSAQVGTAGTQFACGSTDAELATNVAAWADSLTGIDACAGTACTLFSGTSGTAYIWRASDEPGACSVTLSTNDATMAAITSGVLGGVVLYSSDSAITGSTLVGSSGLQSAIHTTFNNNAALTDNGIQLANDKRLVFSSTALYSGTADAGVRRQAAGLVQIYDGVTTTTVRQLRTRLENIVAAVPAEPYACGADTLGGITVVNDTNDSAATQVCYCGMTNDSTYDWLNITSGAACTFF